jgi:hypothetical protein
MAKDWFEKVAEAAPKATTKKKKKTTKASKVEAPVVEKAASAPKSASTSIYKEEFLAKHGPKELIDMHGRFIDREGELRRNLKLTSAGTAQSDEIQKQIILVQAKVREIAKYLKKRGYSF